MAGSRSMKAVISLAGKVDKSLSSAMKSVQKQAQGLSKSLSGIGGKVATGVAAGVAAASGAVAAIGSQALKSYATYEQMVGGVETLFKDSAGIVQQYASEAYKTAGVSANSYMEQATMMSASLIQSLGGDTQQAAAMVDLAIKDMADNSNKFGSDLSSIQQTYQSLMRGNYAMLDNLRLGYGGTKTELERLVSDASKLTGEALDPSKFSDVIKAIHAVQESLDITGTTSKEASTTIEGSLNSAKAAWENWTAGLGTEGADMGELTQNLVSSLGDVANNVGPAVQRIGSALAQQLPSALSSAVSTVGPVIAEALAGTLNSVGSSLGLDLGIDASSIISAFQSIAAAVGPVIQGIGSTIQQVLPALQSGIGGIIESIGPAVQILSTSLGPAISNFATSVIPPLMSAISGILPLLASIANAILPPIINYLTPLISMVSSFASAVIPLLTGAIQALTPAIQLVITVFMHLQPLVSGVMGLFSSVSGIWSNISVAIIPQLEAGFNLLKTGLSGLQGGFQMVQAAASVVVGVFQSVAGAISNIIGLAAQAASAVGSIFAGIGGAIGGLFGFARGGFTNGPYIAGEDPRYPNEAVISFNPAYHAQNVRYWQMAGHMLGAYSASAAPVTAAASGGGGTVIDLSGMTYSPRVEVRGNASKDDIVAALRQSQAEFGDFLSEVLAGQAEVAYA